MTTASALLRWYINRNTPLEEVVGDAREAYDIALRNSEAPFYIFVDLHCPERESVRSGVRVPLPPAQAAQLYAVVAQILERSKDDDS